MLSIRVRLDNSTLYIQVYDGGIGFDTVTGNGSGLTNIKSRAAEISAQVNWTSHAQGTETKIALAGLLG